MLAGIEPFPNGCWIGKRCNAELLALKCQAALSFCAYYHAIKRSLRFLLFSCMFAQTARHWKLLWQRVRSTILIVVIKTIIQPMLSQGLQFGC
eukprot:1158245-Pelagomonas_calceolata.AAC.2